MTGKRKKITVTVGQKYLALIRIDNGQPLKNVAAELGVGTSTVSDWKKNRKGIEDFCGKIVSTDIFIKRGTIKKAKNVILDDFLYEWYIQEAANGIPISGPTLRKKALSLNKMLGCDNTFTASIGWLGRWKARHGVKLNFAGEGLLEDPVSVDSPHQQLVLEDKDESDCLLIQDYNET